MRFTFTAVLVTLFLFLAFSYSLSQTYPEEEYTDVILLKSGGVYLGVKIIRIVSKKKVVVENMDGLEIEIPFRKIYAITDEENYAAVRIEFEANRPPRPGSRLTDPEHFVLLGIASGGGHTSLSAAILNGYYFGNFFTGMGLGWDDRPDGGYVSLLIDVRIYSGIGKTRSYLYSEMGFFGGSRVGLGVGLKIPWGEPVHIMIQGGYRRQGNPDGDSYGAGVFMIGITFRT